ncbi:MAG: hypothetical protein H6850_00160 [Alphaproteobacteria bacterium]|nr:MAG: hypothetical protein H6850_00160 [Alphaproteobacteria bacterium]
MEELTLEELQKKLVLLKLQKKMSDTSRQMKELKKMIAKKKREEKNG